MKSPRAICCIGAVAIGACLAGLLAAAQTNREPTAAAGPNFSEPELDAVIICNAGPQRTPIRPVLLYANERGWNRRFSRFSPRDAQLVRGEKCNSHLLTRILAAASAGRHWVKGQYGDTEMVYCRSDDKRLAIVMDKGDATAVIESVRNELATNSIVWRYAELINKDFPPADEDSIPPYLRDGSSHKHGAK